MARRLRRNSLAIATLVVAFAAAPGTRVSAHRLDELLQAARIGIERDRVQLELSLTPGTSVAARVISKIDTDRDGSVSRQEQNAYAAVVTRALDVSIDGAPPMRLDVLATTFPEVASMRTGDGAMTIRAAAHMPALSSGSHRLLFRNRHAPDTSVYLANALVPDADNVAVTGQDRTGDQRELAIDFVVRDAVAYNRPMLKTSFIALLVVGFVTAALAQAPAFKRTVLQTAELSIAGREAVTAKAELPGGVASGRHTHPGEEIGYVLEGSVSVEIEGQPAKTVKAGETFLIPAGKVHNAVNSLKTQTTIVSTYIVEKGKPLATPAK